MRKIAGKLKSRIEKAGIQIVRLLTAQNHQAFFVGGFVRNLLLNKDSDNLDIATDALPLEVEKILDAAGLHYKTIGKKYGTILAIIDNSIIEITTFRREGKYSDKRHPDQVEFIHSYLTDAKRRDFTINAFYLNPLTREIFDPTKGMLDLKNKVLRFVGNPKERIDEDSLRMLRAVRLASQLEFKIEKNSLIAIKNCAKDITKVAPERVRQEFEKILLSDNRVKGIRLLEETSLLKYIIPQLPQLKNIFHGSKQYHLEGNVFEHTLLLISKLPKDIELLYAGLFHDLGKLNTGQVKIKNGEKIMNFPKHQEFSAQIFLKFANTHHFSRNSTDLIKWLILQHDSRYAYLVISDEKRFEYSLHSGFLKLAELWQADAWANLRLNSDNQIINGKSEAVALGKKTFKRIETRKILAKELSSGKVILSQTKLTPGKDIGRLSKKIFLQILLGKINNKQEVKNFLRNI